MADMIVSGAGTTAVNGTYAEYGTLNGKTRYRMASTASVSGYFYIVWFADMWWISLWGEDGAGVEIMSAARYDAEENVATPDLAATWWIMRGDDPVPTVTAAGATQNLTLTCAAGSYSLTGTNVTLTHTPASQNLTLACNAGSYSLTGTNADLTVTRHYTLSVGGAYPDIAVSGAGSSAANGVWAYTGIQDGKPYYELNGRYYFWSVLLGAWVINFADDGYYYSADDVATPDLVTTWQINGGAQLPVPTVTIATTYTLTGTDATLTYTQGAQSYTLTCEAGSYSLTGTDTTLTAQYNYTLTCEAGSYALTGTATTFEVKRNYVLACSAGSYSLTGTNADLTVTYSAGGVPKQYLHYARLRSN